MAAVARGWWRTGRELRAGVSVVTGAGRSGGGRLGQQDFGRSRKVGAKIGLEMRARVCGSPGHAKRLAGSGGGAGSSCSSLRPSSSGSAAPTPGLPER